MGQSLSAQPFPSVDLVSGLPVELALRIFSYAEPTDLVRSRVVCKIWCQLIDNSDLWRFFCLQRWGHVRCDPSIMAPFEASGRWKGMFKVLYHGSIMFNQKPMRGIEFLTSAAVLRSETHSVALFLSSSAYVDPASVSSYLSTRHPLLEAFIRLRSFRKLFFPEALRNLFGSLSPTQGRPWSSETLEHAMHIFADHYCHCNPRFSELREQLYMLAYTVLLLSGDLHNPLVKRKMTKREFLRNTKAVLVAFSDEYLCRVYDYVFLFGHVASPKQLVNYRAELLLPSLEFQEGGEMLI